MSEPKSPATSSSTPPDPTLDPSTGSTPAPTEPAGGTPEVSPGSASTDADARALSDDPSFGAPPPAEVVDPTATPADDAARQRVEAGSRERVGALKRAREEALRGTEAQTLSGSTSMASPLPTTSSSHPHPSRPAAPPTRPSLIPPYLSRLTPVLSLLLAASGLLAGAWSFLVLPLLHATFAARAALMHAQRRRMDGLVARLREMRASQMHVRVLGPVAPKARARQGGEGEEGEAAVIGDVDTAGFGRGRGGFEEDKDKDNGKGKGKQRAIRDARIREMSTDSSARSSSDRSHANENPDDSRALLKSGNGPGQGSSLEPATPTPLLPDIAPLKAALVALASTRRNTSTTRTSLLSTLEAYSAALHRQMWNPAPSARGWMGSLDRQLSAAGLGQGDGQGKGKGSSVYSDGFEFEGIGDRREEWDAVRKEVRAVKGMLLGRRNFNLGG